MGTRGGSIGEKLDDTALTQTQVLKHVDPDSEVMSDSEEDDFLVDTQAPTQVLPVEPIPLRKAAGTLGTKKRGAAPAAAS